MEKKKSLSVINTYHLVFQALKNQPKLYLPFIFFLLVELVFLFLIYVAPRQPFNVVLAPPIKAFWGERFLHYPANFLLFPKLSSLIRNFISCILGSLLTGAAVFMAADAYNKKSVRMFPALKAAFKKYVSLFAVVLFISILFFYLIKFMERGLLNYFAGHATLLSLKPQVWAGPIMIALNMFILIFIQGLFVYTFPLLMIGNEKLFRAIGKSTALFFKLFKPTVVLIVLPILFNIPIIALQYKTPFLIDKVFPEAVWYVCIAGAIINSLIIDLLITISTTVLFIQAREQA